MDGGDALFERGVGDAEKCTQHNRTFEEIDACLTLYPPLDAIR